MGKVMGYTPSREHEEFAWAWSQQKVQTQLRILREKFYFKIPSNGLKIRDNGEFLDPDHIELFLKKCPYCAARVDVILDKEKYTVCGRARCSEHQSSDKVSIIRRIGRIYDAVVSEWKKNQRINEHQTQPTQPLSDNEGGH